MNNDETLTREQEYQRQYYQDNLEERRRYAQDRWRNNREYQQREIQRAKDRRALARAAKASDRFKAMVEERRAEGAETRPPLLTRVEGENVEVYTTGSLGREVGRSDRAIRMWLRDGTLPGATVFATVRNDESGRDVRRAYFSKRFCAAVYKACEELFYLNGRGEKKVLKRLIMKQLHEADITFVPYEHRGDNGVRVKASIEGE